MAEAAPSVVAANAVARLEVTKAAAALASAGLLSRYHVPLALTPRQERWVERALPRPAARRALRQARRRTLPAEIGAERVRPTAMLSDLARVAAPQLGVSDDMWGRLIQWHHGRFDRLVAAGLDAGDGAVLASAGTAHLIAREARRLGVLTVLNCPSPHHRHRREIIREEARLNPEWTPILQGHEFSDAMLDRYEEEVAHADLLLVLSSHARRTMVEHGVDPGKMVTTPLGVDLDTFRVGPPREEDGVFRVLFVGQVSQGKGFSYLVDGFRRAAIPRSELLVVGHPFGDPRVWDREPGVRALGAVTRRQLPDVFGRADVYVLPSLIEGFPLAAIEAMASGVPVILSTHTFAEDVVTDGENGYIVPIRDAEAICERLRVLAADPDRRRRMGLAGRARAEQFPWSRYGDQVVDVLKTALARR